MKASRLLILVAALLPACGAWDTDEGEPDIRISATATPLAEVSEFGCVIPIRFTLRNDSPFPVIVDRAETLEGYRLTLAKLARSLPRAQGSGWSHAGLLLPGQQLEIEAPHRVIVPEERILLTVRPTTRDELLELISFVVEGETVRATPELIDAFARRPHPALRPPIMDAERTVLLRSSGSLKRIPETIAVVTLPCPEPPFDPWAKGALGKAWTWSQALSGFVFRLSGTDVQLFKNDGMTPLPPVPFEFLRDLDTFAEGVAVIGRNGRRRVVSSGDIQAFLSELRTTRGQLEIGDDPEDPRKTVYFIR